LVEDPQDIADGTVRVDYKPRSQFLPFHLRNQRFACMVAHRRAGKTVACVNELVGRAIHSKKKRPRYAYICPLLKQGKKIAWEYLKEYTQGLIVGKPNISELSVVLAHNGAEISIYGADNPDSFRGQYFDGVVLDEYGDMSPSVWGKVLLPTLADRKGWAVFIGTFKGKNHFYTVYRRSQGLDLRPGDPEPEYFKQNWYSFLLKASESGILSEEELKLQRAEQDEEEFQQEYECNPNASVKGTYYARIIAKLERDGQINADVADWDPEFAVGVFSDLGIGDSTAFWFFQRRPDGYSLIDYEEAHGHALDFYYDLLRGKPYRYERIWLPHDARARTLQTGRSTIELFLSEDVRAPFTRFDRTDTAPILRVAPKLDLQDGISAVRFILPKCWFSTKAIEGVEALRAYKREFDEDYKIFREKPNHDWASHGSDAFRYFALSVKGLSHLQTYQEEQDLKPKIQLMPMFEERERRLNSIRRRIS
jgi:phage terminase large subunit